MPLRRIGDEEVDRAVDGSSQTEDESEHGQDLAAYAAGGLCCAEAWGLEEHVAVCAQCARELAELQQIAALLARSFPIEPAPASLLPRIMLAIEIEQSHRWLPRGSQDRRPAPKTQITLHIKRPRK